MAVKKFCDRCGEEQKMAHGSILKLVPNASSEAAKNTDSCVRDMNYNKEINAWDICPKCCGLLLEFMGVTLSEIDI